MGMMTEPVLSVLAVALRPFAETVFQHLSRLHAERKAGEAAFTQSSTIMDGLLNETLERIRGRDIGTAWWRGLLQAYVQQYVAPDFLKKPALQRWLIEDSVVIDLKALATARIMTSNGDQIDIHDRLAQNYSDFTGEARHLASGPIDVMTAILVAGYIQAIPDDQRALAGLAQTGFLQTAKSIENLKEALSPRADVITRQAHTQLASNELKRSITLRALDPEKSRSMVRDLHERIENSDLVATDDILRTEVQYWLARLCAGDADTLNVAKELRARIKSTDPNKDLCVVDALIAEKSGDPDEAIRLLRDRRDSDSRTTLFGVILRSRGPSTAMDLYKDQLETAGADFFTAAGWRVWACCMADTGKWQQAADQLTSFDGLWSDMPVLAVVEGIVNAQLLLPEKRRTLSEGPLVFDGITPIQGEKAEIAHERAVECFELARSGVEDFDEPDFERSLEEWQRWLHLMDPREGRGKEAHDEIRQNLESDSPDVNLMLFAWCFEIGFDPQTLHTYLSARERLGGLNEEELRAKFLLLSDQVNSGEVTHRDFLTFLESHRARLTEVMPENLLTVIRIETLFKDNQTERARVLLAEDNSLDVVERMRLEAMIDTHTGADPRKHLEAAYRETGNIIDLQSLIHCLKDADDREALLPLLEELVSQQKTVANAKYLVACLADRPFFDHRRIIQFLDSHADLVAQSAELTSARAWALFQAGQLSAAKEVNQKRLPGPGAADPLVLDIRIALAAGDWEHLATIVEREWPRRHEHDAQTLVSLAHLAGQQGGSPERALALARLAANKAPDNPGILTAAYHLHFQFGRDEDADPSWLGRALELSSADEGPVWSADLRTFVTDWMPKRQEQLLEIEQKWTAGEIPTGIAASLLHVPLARVFHHIPESNAEQLDCRRNTIVPIVSGARTPVALQKDWAVGLDVSSVFILHYLGLLELTLDVLGQVRLAPDLMVCLLHELQKVHFHQPSRVKDGQQVRSLHNRQRLRVCHKLDTPAASIAKEVGSELAALFEAARNNDGKVVCVLPLHQPGSLMESRADTTAWNDLIVSIPDLCALLYLQGSIDAEAHKRAQVFLQSQGQLERDELEPRILQGPLYLDRLSLTYLQDANVLAKVASAGLDLRIHPDVLAHMDEFIAAGETGEDLAGTIDEIRNLLRAAVESGRASYLPRKVDPEGASLRENDQFLATQSLLTSAENCDCLCVDDRYINGKDHFVVAKPPEREVPIACTLDILAFLVSAGRLTTEQHWTARHNLRAGALAFIPFAVDELVHWLNAAQVKDGHLVETAELRVLRQAMARTVTQRWTNPEEVFAMSAEGITTCTSAVAALWKDESVEVGEASVKSDWIWRHLIFGSIGAHTHFQTEDRKVRIRDSVFKRATLMFLPRHNQNLDRLSSYIEWVESSLVYALRYANGDLIDDALASIFDDIAGQGSEAEPYGYFFLRLLPELSRQYLLRRFPDRAVQWGFQLGRTFSLDSATLIQDEDLFGAVSKILSGAPQAEVSSTTGKQVVVRFDEENSSILLEWRQDEVRHERHIPELSVLSTDPHVRLTTLRAILKQVGPTATTALSLGAELESRVPTQDELKALFQEIGNGLAAIQARLLHKIALGQPIGATDVLPHDLKYYEKFASPVPETSHWESYMLEILLPYRKALLERDLVQGLEICCLGALRDDLCPGKWIGHVDDDVVWDALCGLGPERTPNCLLAALDIALYRQEDERFQEFAKQAILKLSDDEFRVDDNADMYHLLWILGAFALNRVNLIENVATQPGFWRRMCAWMQVEFVVRGLLKDPGSIAVDSLGEWCHSNMSLSGGYAELVDGREEPMYLSLWRMSPQTLRCEVLGRLVALRSRHESEGRDIPHSDKIDQALERAEERGDLLKCFFPGPLEGQRKVIQAPPDELVRTLNDERPDAADPASWNLILNASYIYKLGEAQLVYAREAVQEREDVFPQDDRSSYLISLELASVVAKINRDSQLVNAIADFVTHIACRISDENDICLILQIYLQAAAAFEEQDAWFDWLEEKLTILAECLPGPPNQSLRILIEQLDAMEMILPVECWFHRRARAIAAAGAELRP